MTQSLNILMAHSYTLMEHLYAEDLMRHLSMLLNDTRQREICKHAVTVQQSYTDYYESDSEDDPEVNAYVVMIQVMMIKIWLCQQSIAPRRLLQLTNKH